nr:hypothetical protein [Tanacetum cinerariifolium]
VVTRDLLGEQGCKWLGGDKEVMVVVGWQLGG